MMKQYPLPLPHREAMEADDFLTTPSNRDPIAWIERWPDWPAHCLVIHGLPGSGKTHLMNVWLARSGGEDVSNQMPDAGKILSSEIRPLSSAIAIDDADQIAGDAAKEESLFHLYNRLNESKSFLLLTAKLAPAQWNIQLPDLRSRLSSIPAVAIAGPDDELLSALLIKQFHDRQIDVAKEVVDFLLPRIERTPASIRNIVTKLDRMSLAENRRITIALARKIIQ
jgi:DnaA regulatory inactivator Hda